MQWISVEDRLPAVYTNVLVFNEEWPRDIDTKFTEKDEQIRIAHTSECNGKIWWNVEPKIYYHTLCNPTHWMPLPLPPQNKD